MGKTNAVHVDTFPLIVPRCFMPVARCKSTSGLGSWWCRWETMKLLWHQNFKANDSLASSGVEHCQLNDSGFNGQCPSHHSRLANKGGWGGTWGGGEQWGGGGEMLKYCQTCFRDHYPVLTACVSNLTTAQDPPSHQLIGTLQNRPLFYYTAHHNSVNPAVVGNTSKQTSVIYTTHHKSVNPAAVSLKTSRRVQMSTQALKAASSLCRKTRKAARPHSLETTTTPAT